MNKEIKKRIKRMPLIRNYVHGRNLYAYYKNEYNNSSSARFIIGNYKRITVVPCSDNKVKQISELINVVGISPSDNKEFFYSIDPFTKVELKNQILDNYSIDYSWIVESSLYQILENADKQIGAKYYPIIQALATYVERLKTEGIIEKSKLKEIESIFTNPATHFHEAIQRILFINQWLWQSGHKHNGFGHLDWILYDLYKKDIDSGTITREKAKELLKAFFLILHDKCWYKSTMLLGDTGQIVVLGGLGSDGSYRCNELTTLFVEVAKELRLPDPKVLLRVSLNTPNDLLKLAMESIFTGIGAPLLSNDEAVIPAMIQFGYDKEDAYDYVTSACWEPLIAGKSCDQNNIGTVDFCKPFIQFINSESFEECSSVDEIKEGYYSYLQLYLETILSDYFDKKEFEEDPLLTLLNPEILKTGKDIVRGGALYANLGLTSVGLSTVVNSLINIDQFVFKERRFSLRDLNSIRKSNYADNEIIRQTLYKNESAFGHDDKETIILTNEILLQASNVLERHSTRFGGRYKIGLSSPNYIVDSVDTEATFDGRKAKQPFGVHISGKNGLSPTELISFASQLDYRGNRINGNVVDLIINPELISNNFEKGLALVKGGIKQKFFQLQVNVVDSRTLINAQKNPEYYSNLVVRVWGFSAYFKDLPKEYQDNLIMRTIEAEKRA